MKLYTTKIEAMRNGELILFQGPNVPGLTYQHAQAYCEANGLGYCQVVGELVAEESTINKVTLN